MSLKKNKRGERKAHVQFRMNEGNDPSDKFYLDVLEALYQHPDCQTDKHAARALINAAHTHWQSGGNMPDFTPKAPKFARRIEASVEELEGKLERLEALLGRLAEGGLTAQEQAQVAQAARELMGVSASAAQMAGKMRVAEFDED